LRPRRRRTSTTATEAQAEEILVAIQLQPLPFSPGALEPHVSAATLELHHGQHEAGYVERVNRLVAGTPLDEVSLEEIIAAADRSADRTLYNSAAQAWNHAFYWRSLSPNGGDRPHGAIGELVDRDFASYEEFAEKLRNTATGHFGSGWAWVVLNGERLEVVSTPNADLPAGGRFPLLAIDVWEHAYYVDYQHRRAAHVAAVIERLLNWEHANQRLAEARAAAQRESQDRARRAV
jgi:Fe-Mn family superoxide dismutase